MVYLTDSGMSTRFVIARDTSSSFDELCYVLGRFINFVIFMFIERKNTFLAKTKV